MVRSEFIKGTYFNFYAFCVYCICSSLFPVWSFEFELVSDANHFGRRVVFLQRD